MTINNKFYMFYKIKYQGGYPEWDKPCTSIMYIERDSIKFEGAGYDCFYLNKDNIIEVSCDKRSSRSVGKTVGGAIVGGVLTGGIGLLIGGAVGASKKNQSELFITYRYDNRELTLSLLTGNKTNDIYSEINSLFVVKEQVPTRQIQTSEPSIDDIIESGNVSSKNGANDEKKPPVIGCMILVAILIALICFLFSE